MLLVSILKRCFWKLSHFHLLKYILKSKFELGSHIMTLWVVWNRLSDDTILSPPLEKLNYLNRCTRKGLSKEIHYPPLFICHPSSLPDLPHTPGKSAFTQRLSAGQAPDLSEPTSAPSGPFLHQRKKANGCDKSTSLGAERGSHQPK